MCASCDARARTADCGLVTGDLPLLGFGLPVSGRWATPETIRRIARRAEELGYASLWTFQRVLSPVAAALGPSHGSVLDPVLPLALRRRRDRPDPAGTATICAPFTAPALLAKTLTSLDVLSGGRLTAGLGWAGCGRSTPPPACPTSGGARAWTSTCAAWRRCGRRTPSSSAASSTSCRARTWARRPCNDRTRRCCWAAPRRRHCAARGGSPRAGSPAASRTSPNSARRWRQCAPARARPGATRSALQIVARRALHGTREPALDELVALRAQGVTEVFLDLNLSPRVDLDDAERVLETFAPTRLRPSA